MPAHSATSGSVIREEAYALGKMLDHSGWNGLLRRNITPSDIDIPQIPLCFDNAGAMIFGELSSGPSSWTSMLTGQRRLYEGLIREQRHCAVLCKHSVLPETGRKIDTLRDVEQFQVMVWDFNPVISPIYDATLWQAFVLRWVNDDLGPMKIRRGILGASVAGMMK